MVNLTEKKICPIRKEDPRPGLQSLLDTHRQPFFLIDRRYRIVAVNRAFADTFNVDEYDVVGQPCYRVSRNRDVPCQKTGGSCPLPDVMKPGAGTFPRTCAGTVNGTGRSRFTAFQLQGENGEVYLGEMLEQAHRPFRRSVDGRRLVGASAAFRSVMGQLAMSAGTDVPVLVQGETGTGKEIAAQFIHANSARRDRPFLTVDCTVLTDTLFEAEVFGHARGAYTGSVGERTGLFEQADGGTLFMDEMGELPLSQQAKLLRFLETGEFRRVGGSTTRSSNVRIICATNRCLQEAVKAGTFRNDLYYRIACLGVRMPPIRERSGDIRELAPALLAEISHNLGRDLSLAVDALYRLEQHDYPGNVRELKNILYSAAAHCTGSEIDARLVSDTLKRLASTPDGGMPDSDYTQPAQGEVENLRDIEAQLIARLLVKYGYSRKKVAAAMGISERTLYRKIRLYDLCPG